MRFKLTLQLQHHLMGREIPINYQYELSAAIYRILSKADRAYAAWLHDNGFWVDGKRFKLFTFSWLLAPYGIDRERQRLIINPCLRSPSLVRLMKLLIVPYGIESTQQRDGGGRGRLLLIVPYGIERAPEHVHHCNRLDF